MNDNFDNRGQVSVWKGDGSNPKAPILKGTAVAHRNIREGEELDIAFWKNESDNPKAPTLRGKLGDKYKKEPQRGGYTDDPGIPFDDSLPF
jgi:hypothetical protein